MYIIFLVRFVNCNIYTMMTLSFVGQGKELRSGSKTFMVFGAGIRQCAGSEFARLQISIFLHHLVTTYDFSLSKDCEVVRVPGALFPNGIYMNISKCSKVT